MKLGKNKRLSKIVLLTTLVIIGWLVFEIIVKGFNVVNEQYGIDPMFFLTILIISEIFFNIGIILMILGSGIIKLRLNHIFNLDFQNVTFENELVYTGFTLNRIAAFVPPAYLLVSGWDKLPPLISSLLFVELSIVLLIASIPLEFNRIFNRKKVIIRNVKISDLEDILEVDNDRYGDISKEVTATGEMMGKRIENSKEWFFVADMDGKVKGILSLMPTNKGIKDFTSWEDSTDNGTLDTTFDSNGRYVYGVALTTSPDVRGLELVDRLFAAAGRKLIAERKKMAYFSGRMPDFHKFRQEMTPEEYYSKRIIKDGKEVALDPQIRMYESFGLEKVRLVENGFVGDKESGNYGVLFKATNPFYSLLKLILGGK